MTPERVAVGAVAALLILLLGGCGASGQVVDLGAAPTRTLTDATSSVAPPDGSLPGGGAGPGGAGSAGTSGEPGKTKLTVFFTRGEQIAAVPRTVPRVPRIGSAVLEQLLAGPTGDERAAGYGTEIPSTSRLRNLAITNQVAVVDLSGDFESGGGTLGVTLRLAQVVCTLDQFPTVDGVRFALDGKIVDVFAGDGLVIAKPVSCSDYADYVAG